MYVNITESGGTYSADKTFAEIESAIESEYSVVANVKEGNEELEIGFILPLAHFVSGSVVMFALYLDGSFYSASVASNNFASYSEVKIPAISISFTPTSTVTADNVQEAIEEIAGKAGLTQEQADARYLQLTGGTLTGDISIGSDVSHTFLLGSETFISSGGGTDVGVRLMMLDDGTYMNLGTVNGTRISISPGTEREYGEIKIVSDYTTINGLVSPSASDDAANKAYVDSKAPTSVTVTLAADGWTNTMAPVEPGGETVGHQQTVTVSGVVASETAQLITPTPAIASQSAYYEAGIMCTGQATNSLTFTCQTVPTSNLTVYVVIQPLS